MPLAFTLAVLAGLLDFVPNFGPLVSAVPAVVLAFTKGPSMAAYVALMSYVLAPLVQHRTVALPPALLIVSQLLLGTLFGSMGLIVATPLTVVVLQLVRDVYIQRILEDNAGGPGGRRSD